jgi:hypothetical protein
VSASSWMAQRMTTDRWPRAPSRSVRHSGPVRGNACRRPVTSRQSSEVTRSHAPWPARRSSEANGLADDRERDRLDQHEERISRHPVSRTGKFDRDIHPHSSAIVHRQPGCPIMLGCVPATQYPRPGSGVKGTGLCSEVDRGARDSERTLSRGRDIATLSRYGSPPGRHVARGPHPCMNRPGSTDATCA